MLRLPPDAESTAMARIFFATNRNPIGGEPPKNFGKRFSPDGLVNLRFGHAEVEGGRIVKIVVAREKLDVPPDALARGDLSAQQLGSTAVFELCRKEMMETGSDLLVYIHGFDFTFREAILRAAEIKAFYAEKPLLVFVFTWPGDGSKLPFLAYASDRDDARASGAALGRGLQKLAHYLRGTHPEDYCGRKMHILAHSMGNYALRHAVQAIESSSGGRIRRLFDQVLLMAADEDHDAFEADHKLKPLPKMCKRVSVYINPDDLALVVSDKTKGNPDRLGASGPLNSWSLPDKVSVVNCERAIDRRSDRTGHQYYRNNPTVRRDLIDVLNGADPVGRTFDPEKRWFFL